MLAPAQLPDEFKTFNARHHAPHGTWFRDHLRRFGERSSLRVLLAGPYAWQQNNQSRRFEYPWAFAEVQSLGNHLRIADVGASLAGLQYTLARAGHEVHAVDPGLAATGVGWEVDPDFHNQIARIHRAPVELHPTTLADARFNDQCLDVVLSVSTIEHFGRDDLEAFAEAARRALRPGGHLILTIDLFLDLAPFTDRESNRWGTNMDVRHLLDAVGAEIVVGEPSELFGFPEFDSRQVQSALSKYLIGSYPTLTQCVVARVPGTTPGRATEPTVPAATVTKR